MNLNQLAKEIHSVAIEHGWWDEPRRFGEIIALCHSELSEALEEYRNGMPNVYYRCKVNIEEGYEGKETIADGSGYCNIPCEECSDRCEKPEGIAVELADCIIRILDYYGHESIDADKLTMDFKKVMDFDSFGDFITICHSCLSCAYCIGLDEGDWFEPLMIPLMMFDCTTYIYKWAEKNGVDMDSIIRIKHEYNKSRPYRHGGKVM
jgi:hypothetical protein